ncbi:DUF4959 domain-containing protein [Bacteroides acidifaciens]|uniref:DUF4959 domain-containing protein n=1 Tax=Bacteroides acidifaciens TaxID=85831 RepID=UPI00242FEB1D|nr:DUF4959 domain-containing protein [Bacteroides acidifaciens]
MKKKYLFMACFAAMFMASACSDDNDKSVVVPSAISDLTATPLEGGVMLEWKVPVDSNLFYVQVDYTHPVTGRHINKKASVFCDMMLIEDMLAKDGEYTFHVTPVSSTQNKGEVLEVKATALPVQPVVKEITNKVLLGKENLFCNKPDPDEGKYIEYLVDGNFSNFFHTDWHNAGTDPHYLDISFPSPVEQFKVQTFYRGGKYGQCPVEITVLGSNDGEQWNKIASIEDDGEGGSSYTTPTLGAEGQPYSYIRYRADKTSDNLVFFALAELEIYTVKTEIYDPEGIYRPEE